MNRTSFIEEEGEVRQITLIGGEY
jgi:hypothetical protein